jgi:putative tricarboxylic transport membrane protein
VTVALNLALIPLFVRVLAMPFTILTPIIFILCFVGVFATTDRMFDVWLMLVLGLGGYLLRKLNYPVAPAVLAIVLGPLAERSMRQSLIGSQGDVTTFISISEHPISLGCIVIAVVLMLYPVWSNYRRKIANKTAF